MACHFIRIPSNLTQGNFLEWKPGCMKRQEWSDARIGSERSEMQRTEKDERLFYESQPTFTHICTSEKLIPIAIPLPSLHLGLLAINFLWKQREIQVSGIGFSLQYVTLRILKLIFQTIARSPTSYHPFITAPPLHHVWSQPGQERSIRSHIHAGQRRMRCTGLLLPLSTFGPTTGTVTCQIWGIQVPWSARAGPNTTIEESNTDTKARAPLFWSAWEWPTPTPSASFPCPIRRGWDRGSKVWTAVSFCLIMHKKKKIW